MLKFFQRRLSSSVSTHNMHNNNNNTKFDIIVVGGGHAGCEAATAAYRIGARVALVTNRRDTIGVMSCNPSIGGIGKGHLVREIDALGGLMARCADAASIQCRVLNRSKGAAVHGPRVQADRQLYQAAVLAAIDAAAPRLTVVEAAADAFSFADLSRSRVSGVVLSDGVHLHADAVVLTTGTFLGGRIHLGNESWPSGRMGDAPTSELSTALREAGFDLGRLKTGTPPRLDARQINYAGLLEQRGDEPPEPLSFSNEDRPRSLDQRLCHLTHTTARTHELVSNNSHLQSFLDSTEDGRGIGPRYCPSLEAKVRRFPDRFHQIWLEPEGFNTHVVYPNGLSMSLPRDVQRDVVRSIRGLEACDLVAPGYYVEYDFLQPTNLHRTLETKLISRLYLAGQINGTTGYEEAGAQGLWAGANAALTALGCTDREFVLSRADAYVGVLVDDLTRNGADEPYRMFTSRAEYRLTLRADNADARLTEIGHRFGLCGDEQLERLRKKQTGIAELTERLRAFSLTGNEWHEAGLATNVSTTKINAFDVLGRPQISWEQVKAVVEARTENGVAELARFPRSVTEALTIESKYHAYLYRQARDIERFRENENAELPRDIDYNKIALLSTEEKEKLNRVRPATLGAASRISGITAASLVSLLKFARKLPRNATTSS
jgi:tRNA uridine 5-carboxymethylaminomethyl modification enzyme